MVAKLCRLIASSGLKKQGGGAFTEDEFMPFMPLRQLRKQSDAEVESIIGAALAPVKKEANKKVKQKKSK